MHMHDTRSQDWILKMVNLLRCEERIWKWNGKIRINLSARRNTTKNKLWEKNELKEKTCTTRSEDHQSIVDQNYSTLLLKPSHLSSVLDVLPFSQFVDCLNWNWENSIRRQIQCSFSTNILWAERPFACRIQSGAFTSRRMDEDKWKRRTDHYYCSSSYYCRHMKEYVREWHLGQMRVLTTCQKYVHVPRSSTFTRVANEIEFRSDRLRTHSKTSRLIGSLYVNMILKNILPMATCSEHKFKNDKATHISDRTGHQAIHDSHKSCTHWMIKWRLLSLNLFQTFIISMTHWQTSTSLSKRIPLNH